VVSYNALCSDDRYWSRNFLLGNLDLTTESHSTAKNTQIFDTPTRDQNLIAWAGSLDLIQPPKFQTSSIMILGKAKTGQKITFFGFQKQNHIPTLNKTLGVYD
jgi:hypothetical protein